MAVATLGLAFVAGTLSILSPCVLPLLPIVLGSAAGAHRAGPLALAAGVTLSFVAIGLFLATAGFAIGLDGEIIRRAAALLMIAAGAVLMSPTLQVRLAAAGGPLSNWADQRAGRIRADGLGGQFAIGALLGAVWSPCAGPTLGAASVLAAQGSTMAEAGVVMLVFGLGAALPLVGLGLLSRQALARWRDRLLSGGKGAKIVLGLVFVVIGVAIVTGLDRTLEAALVALSPEWLTVLTTRF